MVRILALAVLAGGLFAAPAFAKMDCEAQFDSAQAALSSMKNLTPGARAARARIAQHAYDLCMVGDESSSQKFFQMMMQNGN